MPAAEATGAQAREEKHINLFHAFHSMKNAVSEMEDLLTRVRGIKSDKEGPSDAPVEPNPDTLSDALNNLPGFIREETKRLNDIRASLTDELF